MDSDGDGSDGGGSDGDGRVCDNDDDNIDGDFLAAMVITIVLSDDGSDDTLHLALLADLALPPPGLRREQVQQPGHRGHHGHRGHQQHEASPEQQLLGGHRHVEDILVSLVHGAQDGASLHLRMRIRMSRSMRTHQSSAEVAIALGIGQQEGGVAITVRRDSLRVH